MDQLNKFTILLSSSMIQAIADNPLTSYRQLLQQYTKDKNGNYINPKLTNQKVRKNFLQKSNQCCFFRFKSKINWKFYKTCTKIWFNTRI